MPVGCVHTAVFISCNGLLMNYLCTDKQAIDWLHGHDERDISL